MFLVSQASGLLGALHSQRVTVLQPPHFLANGVIGATWKHSRSVNLKGTPSQLPSIVFQYLNFGLGILLFDPDWLVRQLSGHTEMPTLRVYCCRGLIHNLQFGQFVSLPDL